MLSSFKLLLPLVFYDLKGKLGCQRVLLSLLLESLLLFLLFLLRHSQLQMVHLQVLNHKLVLLGFLMDEQEWDWLWVWRSLLERGSFGDLSHQWRDNFHVRLLGLMALLSCLVRIHIVLNADLYLRLLFQLCVLLLSSLLKKLWIAHRLIFQLRLGV